MTLNQVINNLKYKSSIISVYDKYDDTIFSDTLGVFLTSVKRQQIGEEIVDVIYPYACSDKDFHIKLLNFELDRFKLK